MKIRIFLLTLFTIIMFACSVEDNTQIENPPQIQNIEFIQLRISSVMTERQFESPKEMHQMLTQVFTNVEFKGGVPTGSYPMDCFIDDMQVYIYWNGETTSFFVYVQEGLYEVPQNVSVSEVNDACG